MQAQMAVEDRGAAERARDAGGGNSLNGRSQDSLERNGAAKSQKE